MVLNTNFFDVEDHIPRAEDSRTFYTGPIDRFFAIRGSPLPLLPYRSIHFERMVVNTRGVALPNSVVNYPQYVDGMLVYVCMYVCMYVRMSKNTRGVAFSNAVVIYPMVSLCVCMYVCMYVCMRVCRIRVALRCRMRWSIIISM